jgi:hypothetical protein
VTRAARRKPSPRWRTSAAGGFLVAPFDDVLFDNDVLLLLHRDDDVLLDGTAACYLAPAEGG